ncbi:aminomethyl-transferring glycine dehydrogenase subunit GcvPA [bacterium]
MKFIPHTLEQINYMKDKLGVSNIDELFKDIPDELRLKKELDLPESLSEIELRKKMEEYTSLNDSANKISFLGGGIYDHYIPEVVNNLSSRSEFVTAYTPYQAELSQGALQAIYEYQTYITRLTGLDVSNASLYDGANSILEACKVAVNFNKKKKIVLSSLINPQYRKVLYTGFANTDVELVEASAADGVTNLESVRELAKDASAIVVSQVNYFGMVEDIEAFADTAHKNDALLVAQAYPIALGILKSPGTLGSDIVVGEGQSLGLTLSFGGSTLGFFAAKKDFIRLVPGRIVGRTTDKDGNEGYVLTLQAREQHIRRARALSNICSNQAHCALRAAIYLAAMGKTGLRTAALSSMKNAYYFANQLDQIEGLSVVNKKGFFNEFVLKIDDNIDFEKFDESLKLKNILLGIKLLKYFKEYENHYLVAVTETKTKDELDKVIEIVRETIGGSCEN